LPKLLRLKFHPHLDRGFGIVRCTWS